MTRKGQNLLDLLVRRETKTAAVSVVRPVRTCTLSELFVKRAQAKSTQTGPLLARDEQNPYQAGVDRMLKEEARGPAPLTDKDYAQRFKRESDAMTPAQRQAQEQAYWQKQPITQRKSDMSIIQGNRGMKTWGDRLDSVLGKGDPNAGVRTMRPVNGPKWWQTANQWADAGANMAKDVFSRETLHDIANNAQMATESVGKGAKDVWNFARRWLNPSMYGDSWKAKQNRMSLANDVANTETDYNDRMARILGNSQTGLDDIQNSTVAKLNAGGMMGAGQSFAGAATTAGLGSVARLASKGINAAAVCGGAQFGRLASAVTKPLGTRVSTAAGRWANQGVREAARAATVPLNTVYRATGFALNPNQFVRSVESAMRHPLRTAGNLAGQGFYAWDGYNTVNNVANGDYGSAIGDLASLGAFGGAVRAFGPGKGTLAGIGAATPYLGYQMLYGDGDNPEDAE